MMAISKYEIVLSGKADWCIHSNGQWLKWTIHPDRTKCILRFLEYMADCGSGLVTWEEICLHPKQPWGIVTCLPVTIDIKEFSLRLEADDEK